MVTGGFNDVYLCNPMELMCLTRSARVSAWCRSEGTQNGLGGISSAGARVDVNMHGQAVGHSYFNSELNKPGH